MAVALLQGMFTFRFQAHGFVALLPVMISSAAPALMSLNPEINAKLQICVCPCCTVCQSYSFRKMWEQINIISWCWSCLLRESEGEKNNLIHPINVFCSRKSNSVWYSDRQRDQMQMWSESFSCRRLQPLCTGGEKAGPELDSQLQLLVLSPSSCRLQHDLTEVYKFQWCCIKFSLRCSFPSIDLKNFPMRQNVYLIIEG